MLQVLGPITVPVPGVPARATSTITTDAGGIQNDPTKFSCHAALFQARPGNTGNVYIGTSNMVRATLVGVAAVLAIPTANSIPAFSIALTLAPAGVDLSELYVDADVADEGVLLTLLVT